MTKGRTLLSFHIAETHYSFSNVAFLDLPKKLCGNQLAGQRAGDPLEVSQNGVHLDRLLDFHWEFRYIEIVRQLLRASLVECQKRFAKKYFAKRLQQTQAPYDFISRNHSDWLSLNFIKRFQKKKKKTASREVSKGKTFRFKKARKLGKLVGEATAVVPFLNARCNFWDKEKMSDLFFGVFLLNRKKIATQGRIRSSRSNPDLSYRNLSPLPLHYHTDQPKIPKKFST